MKGNKNDFIADGERIVTTKSGIKYRRATGPEELSWAEKYISHDEQGNMKFDAMKKFECQIENIIDVPWDRDTIKDATGKDKTWAELEAQEKKEMFKKLKKSVFAEVLQEINEEEREEELKKKA
jgi:hypothetical protein